MRSKHRTIEPLAGDLGPAGDEAQYCVLCEGYVVFEQVEAEDLPSQDTITEWICVQCGSAVFLDPPAQPLDATG
ncbi:hypothetical protein [Kribbella deserti]|uniref:Lysine biosynthesis protein LysW n=1 Tax=Kribbella deserti TaxID=1926257 RepID=A0ABV6QPP4_9ACTN